MQDWFVGIVGSDLAPLATIVLSALVVVLLVYVVITLMKGMMRGGMGFRASDGPRVEIVDVTSVDPKRKLVLVRRDQVEHLLLIGGGNDLVIEARIGRPAPPPARRIEHPGMGEAPAVAGRQEPSAEPARSAKTPGAGADAMAARQPEPPRAPETLRAAPAVTADAPRSENPRRQSSFAPPPVEASSADDRLDNQTAPERRPGRETPDVQTPAAPVHEPAKIPPRPAIAAPAAAAREPEARPATSPRSYATPAVDQSPRRAPEIDPPVRSRATATLPASTRNDAPAERARQTPPVETPTGGERREPSFAAPREEKPASPVLNEAPPPNFGKGDSRAPLTVRSFASVIGERDKGAPAPLQPKTVAPPPVPASPPTRSDEDDLERMLALELAEDEPTAERTSGDTPDDASRPAEQARETPTARARDLTIEEEMERLMRDFATHTSDRRDR